MNITQLGLSLIEGLGLILSPCILPILPIMLAASLDGGRRRPLGIIAGFIGAFTAFALLSRQLLTLLHADPGIVRDVALILLIVFGIIMLSKKLSDGLLGVTQGLANFGQTLTARWDQKQGFFSGVAIGALIGLIWTPCAGPILAATIVQIIQAKTSLEAVLTVVMFALGAGLPMLLIALMGRQILSRLGFLKTHSYAVRKVMGLIIIAAAGLIYAGADVQLLAASDGVPMPKLMNESLDAPLPSDGKLRMALDHPYPAPELAGIQDWINSPPLKISDLRGKVVLIDFWTYSCINCVRTLPYITRWDAAYRNKGLVIIGVHSPEFEFEKKLENVRDATVKFGIHYPVALDSNLETWTAFKNQYWPAHYLIDKSGRVVYTHFGEGAYDVTESNIRALLGVSGGQLASGGEGLPHKSGTQTPETYLGYARAQNFADRNGSVHDEDVLYRLPETLAVNQWGLAGAWRIGSENITSTVMGQEKSEAPADAHVLRLNFVARKVFLVLGSADGIPKHLQVFLNGKPVTTSAGADVKNGQMTVDQERLYELIDQGSAQKGELQLETVESGLQAYAFTFGG